MRETIIQARRWWQFGLCASIAAALWGCTDADCEGAGCADGEKPNGGLTTAATENQSMAEAGASPAPPPAVATSADTGSAGPSTVTFESTTLSTDFFAEGAAVGDVDADGIVDLIAGPHWYRGPSYELGGRLFDAPSFTPDSYSTFFLTFVDDLDADGYLDVIAIGGPGGDMGDGTNNGYWYENPGPDKLDQAWPKHLMYDGVVSNESPAYVDLVGDARKELVFMTDQQLGYATPGPTPTDPWVFSPVSEARFATPYVHGLGVGDVNADALPDIIEASGWWEQPDDAAAAWIRHPVDFSLGGQGGAQMIVYDVDGDLDADVVASLNAHGYGLAWFEQATADRFIPHEILPATNAGISFSQQHAMAAGDINGDGLLDIVTGKRYYAHPSTRPDPGTDDDPVLYWFELSRGSGAAFIPHLVDSDSGVGCNFALFDEPEDGRPAIFVSNKRGTFLHRQL